MVNLPRKDFRKTFRPGEHRRNHDISPYPGPMQFIQSSNPVLYGGSVWFK